MINQSITDFIKSLPGDHDDIMQSITLLETFYPHFDDHALVDILNNELISNGGRYTILEEHITDDIITILSIHGVITDDAPLDILNALCQVLVDIQNPETMGLLLELAIEGDPEYSFASMADFLSTELEIGDFIDKITDVDPELFEKMGNLDDTSEEIPSGLTTHATTITKRITDLSLDYPKNVGSIYIANGGAVGGSANHYKSILKTIITKGDVHINTTEADIGSNVVALHLLSGVPLETAKRRAIETVDEWFELEPTSKRIAINTTIKNIGA